MILRNTGIPSLGLRKMDPLRISKLGIDQGIQSIKLRFKFNDLDIINMIYLIVKKAMYEYHWIITVTIR